MLRYTLCTVLAMLVGANSAAGRDEVYSGPQPGEPLPAFRVLETADDAAGQETTLLADDAGPPTLIVFVHEATRPGLQLMRPLDLYASKLADQGLAAYFVWLTADRTKTTDWLRVARNSMKLKSPIMISCDGVEGPGNYGLNRKVSLTILMGKKNRVTANFAIVQPNETDAPKILNELAKLMGRDAPALDELRAELGAVGRREMARPPAATPPLDPPPPAPAAAANRIDPQITELRRLHQEQHERAMQRIELLEKTIAELTAALNDARATIAMLDGKPAPEPIKLPAARPEPRGEKPRAELPGRTPDDPELITLMRQLIQKDLDPDSVPKIVQAMRSWAGDDARKQTDLKLFCVRIAHVGYGSEAAKRAIQRLAAGD